MSSLPLPWWTSKSTSATRSSPWWLSAWRMPTATLSKKQKPIGASCVAWWPGGRTAQNAVFTSPFKTRSVASTAAPAARSAARAVCGFIAVSGSTWT